MRNMTSLLIFILALNLGGCAARSQVGNFIQPTVTVLDQPQLAADAVQQITTLYAPAHTRLELQQSTPDLFGKAFVQALRDKGYALQEFVQHAASTAGNKPSLPTEPGGLPVSYVLDHAGEPDLFRLTVVIGHQSITRPFLARDGAFTPAGYWVRKE